MDGAEEGGDLVAWLQSGAAFGGDPAVRRIETHAARVFLSGDRAWKIKRPVNLGYLDFSTVRARRDVLEAEIRLNRRTAPDLYLGLHRISRADDGFRLDGDGETVDWILEMRRFPDDALLDRQAARGTLDPAMLQSLADGIVAFHADAACGPRTGGAERLRGVVAGNGRAMAAFPAILDPARAAALSDRHWRTIDAEAALLDARARAGRIRHVHGDLHLGNIALVDGVPTPFDCLEFDPELATTDLLYDLAFLLMDLWARDLRDAANRVFNRYLDRSAADEAGVGLLPLFMSVRAAIRAHVLAAKAGDAADGADADGARRYLALAERLIAPAPTGLVAVGGLSGTGKSTLARAVGGAVGRPPGARILRSDALRKRLAGVPIETRLPPDAYSPEASAAVYAALGDLAGAALEAGQSVVADAVFGRPEERQAIARVAEAAGRPFAGVWLTLPEAERIGRIEARGADASDADAAVARMQSRTLGAPVDDWTCLPAGGAIDGLRDRLVALLAEKGLAPRPVP